MGIQFSMEDGILGSVTGMKMLHERREIAVDREEGGHEVALDHFRREGRSFDRMGDMKTNLSILHVHFEFS